jgi:hypothetical protein
MQSIVHMDDSWVPTHGTPMKAHGNRCVAMGKAQENDRHMF